MPLRFINGHNGRKFGVGYEIEDRGWNSACWIWRGATKPSDYAVEHRGAVHIRLWIERNGPIPEGRELHHLCQIKTCINPEHLMAVTRAEHLRLHSRLTESDVSAIRTRPLSQRQLAALYGISKTQVGRIQRRESWV